MALSNVTFRDPFPPHCALAVVEATNIKYGRLLMAPSTASFEVRINDIALATVPFQFGAMVSIERDDGLFPWVGMVTRRTFQAGAPTIQFELKDHAGGLFARAFTPENFLSLFFGVGGLFEISKYVNGDAATKIRLVLEEIDKRQSPPLLIKYDLASGGPVILYLPQAVSIVDFLIGMHELTNWEWGLNHTLTFDSLDTQLLWRERIGKDLRGQVSWEENHHFHSLTFTQDASKFVETAIVIGAAKDEESKPPIATSVRDRTNLPPVLRGTVLEIELRTSDQETLQAEADRLRDDPTNRGEHVSFSLVESEIDVAGTDSPNPGDIVRIRFTDATVLRTRLVRILGTQHTSGTGIIEVEADVIPEEEDNF